jgi:hypothetical protein
MLLMYLTQVFFFFMKTLVRIFEFQMNPFLQSLSWGSSGSIVSDYRLDDRGSIPDRGKVFFL